MKLELNNYISTNPHFNEVKLFQEVSQYLSAHYQCVFIEETHQQYVGFHSSIAGCFKKREISDLWIITYSILRQEAKMTFLQAKLKKNYRPAKIPFSFKADYFQFDLLSKRPSIKDLSKFGFPQDILSSAILESVGTYGIFFYDNLRNIDFAFSTAAELQRGRIPATCFTGERTLYFPNINSGYSRYLRSQHGDELRCSLDADHFEFCLLNLFIGTPIQNDLNVLSYLRSLLSAADGNSSEAVINFVNFVNGIQPDNERDFDFQKGRNPRILLINVDPIEPKNR